MRGRASPPATTPCSSAFPLGSSHPRRAEKKTAMTNIPTRTEWFNPFLDQYEAGTIHEVMVPCHPRLPVFADLDANLVSSRLATKDHEIFGDWHSPVLDIDFEARLIPSSTPGHYH